MASSELHIMMKQLINNQGASFITDKRFTNILLDMGCFDICPKCKNVLKTINENDYANRILSYIVGYEAKDDTFMSIFDELSAQYNYAKNDISYCIQCILYGLNVVDAIDKYSTKLDYSWLNQLDEYCNVAQEEVDAWNAEYCVINITPADAEVYIDGRRIKHEDEPFVVELSCNEHKIKVCASMYHHYEENFNVMENEENSFTIELEPQFGSILIMTNSNDAIVYIDDIKMGKAPFSMEKLLSGTHTLKITDALHKKYEEVFVIKDGEKLQKTIELEPNFGDVLLCTEDEKLQIYIDGQYQGNGKWNRQLSIGYHCVECKKESHFSKSIDIYVKLGDESNNTFELPILEAYYGCLKVNVKPIGSTVYLDGQEIGKSPLKYKNALIGKHVVTIVEQECGNKLEKEIDIEEGIITVVEEPIPQIFFNDYDKAEIGDYFYIDGSLSHQKSKEKKAVGIVFTLETTEEEKKHGWTHGQIIALNNASVTEWSKNKIKSHVLPKYDSKHWNIVAKDKDGYKYSHIDSIYGNSKYKAFFVAEKYNIKVPIPSTTSGWYLPTIGQFNDVLINLLKMQIKEDYTGNLCAYQSSAIGYWKNTKEYNILQNLNIAHNDWFWVTNLTYSKLTDYDYGWTIRLGYDAFIGTGCPLSCNNHKVRTVAAF